IDWNGSNLYYSSDAPQGLGGSDIYRAVLISIESMSLSLPQNLGTPINSRHNEQRFVQMVGSTESLIISDRGKARRYGMFSVYTQESESRGYFIRKTPNSSQRVWINQTTDNRSGIPEITLKGQVTGQSGVDGEQILEISFKLAGVSRRVWTKLDRSGNYSINVPSADVYTIELSIPGYFRHYQDILRNPNETSLRHDIVMSKLDPRVTVILQNILFEYNSDVILPSSQTSLDNAVNTLLDNPDIRVEISGHTSSDGSDAYNLELSRKRAKAVEVYLIKRGVPADRLKSVGYGETKPLNDNSTEAFRKMNRRVEFRVL
ncbi:MAG TPA: OmpA family protein, partial [Candidatus Cloacimonadota bacterium]|nr:OmpA family protein [Candidatus Cloacimonadota bacterium]